MREDERIWAVKELLSAYVKSPSLRHIRDGHSLNRLAQEIMRSIDRGNTIWRKWDAQRDVLLKSAVGCWIPIEDLREFLNGMPGPRLTTTDVDQRLKAFEEEQYWACTTEELREGCFALYEAAKAEGTEMPAIIGLLREHVESEEERIRTEHQEQYRRRVEQERVAREQRLLSGADCGWTQLSKSPHWFCRTNGRTYRLSPTKDRMWNLHRIQSVLEDEKGAFIGKYQRRRDVTKVIAQMAYQPEPRW